MRRLGFTACALAIAAVAAPLWGGPAPSAPPANVAQALSGIDFVPARNELDRLFAGDVAALVGVANDEGDGADAGVRLRAYRSLRHFGGDATARDGLRTAVARYRSARRGIDVLYLIAAVGSLAEIGEAVDVDTIVPLLDAGESRDLRAAAARALGHLGTSTACARLRARTSVELQPLVLKAIDRALQHPDCQGPL